MVKPLEIKPEWIIIDSKVTDYKNLAKISDEGAKIVTLRYRSKEMVEAVGHIEDWEVVRIKRAKGGYAKIRAHEKPVTRRYKDDDEKGKKLEMREVIVTDNGREKPIFIITTDFEHSMKDIIRFLKEELIKILFIIKGIIPSAYFTPFATTPNTVIQCYLYEKGNALIDLYALMCRSLFYLTSIHILLPHS